MNTFLIIGGVLSFLASFLHIVIIVGGAIWYRYFGAGERMATLAEQGSWIPGVVTFLIAVVLFTWGLYALSGAGLIAYLPFIKPILILVSITYLARGLVLFPALIIRPDLVDGFAVWSSLASLGFGMCYAVGTWQVWEQLS